MKKSEEINLNHQIEFIRDYVKDFPDFSSFYLVVGLMPLVSIQDLSFEKDIEFFKELQFILSVVMSIIAKPHLNNRRDEIIARAGEVTSLSQEDFQKTLKDASLWKDNGELTLLPEHVYYHTYEDEIKIYENIFIVALVNEISYIIDQYTSLYMSLLNVIHDHSSHLLLDDEAQKQAMDAVNYISHRMDQIKDTYFYREINRKARKIKVFYPTNILLKDRLYNICFKYYRKLHVIDDHEKIEDSLFIYYFMHIVRHFSKEGYSLDYRLKAKVYDNEEFIIPTHLAFTRPSLRIDMDIDRENLSFSFTYKDSKDDRVSKHKLIITNDASFTNVAIKEEKEYFSTEYLSSWHLGEVNKGKIILLNETLMDEPTLVDTFFKNHHLVIDASEKIYTSYCPTCKNKNLIHRNDDFYQCEDCGAIYKFMKGNGDKTSNKIVLAKLGKR